MWLEVVLVLQIRLLVFTDVVTDERDRYDEGNGTLTVKVDNLQQLLFFIRRKLFLEITQDVDHNVGIFPRRRRKAKGLHEKFLVLFIELFQGYLFGLGHQSSHHPVVLGAVRED